MKIVIQQAFERIQSQATRSLILISSFLVAILVVLAAQASLPHVRKAILCLAYSFFASTIPSSESSYFSFNFGIFLSLNVDHRFFWPEMRRCIFSNDFRPGKNLHERCIDEL